MPEYRLHYFNGRGAAEPARILFALAGVEYEDVRCEDEDWLAKKPQMPLEALPVLEIDGKMFTQSQAMIRYLAREYGTADEKHEVSELLLPALRTCHSFYGASNMETFRIDEIHEAVVELQRELYKVRVEKDETKKKEINQSFVDTIVPKFMNFFERICRFYKVYSYYVCLHIRDKKEINQSFVDTIVPKFMNFFERRLTENGGGDKYFVGDGMTLADVLVYNIIFNMEFFLKLSTDKWTKTTAVCKKMETHPKIAAWLKERPQTDY